MIEPKSIIRTRRRSIALLVNSQGELVVRAPYYVTTNMIMDFVQSKQKWIEKQQKQIETEKNRFPNAVIAIGGTIQYGGVTYNIDREDVEQITLFGNYILLPKNAGEDELRLWLQNKAAIMLRERAEIFAQRMQVNFKRIRLSAAKSRWGSCSYCNALRFSWRLIMCPPEVLNYVVVHELCHIDNKSHNKMFWQHVGQVLPNYQGCEKWLKENRRIMEIL